jgi:hydroxyacylglutathione hydrolase
MQAPGHTIESISVVVTDLEKPEQPMAVLTGDTLFIGDVGRPDLSGDMTPQQLAGMLYDSLHTKLLRLPDEVLVYPAHGAGSLCGRQMSAERSSTIGKEKLSNYALRPTTREEFVKLLTAELPERPGYFALDVEMNRSGAPALQKLAPVPAFEASELLAKQEQGAIVLDTRPAREFGAGHIPGSIQIGLAGQYASWAAIVLGLDSEILLVAEDEEKVEESRLRLTRVGIERVTGYLKDGMAGWIRDGLPVRQTSQVTAQQLHQLLGEDDNGIQVVDVRRSAELQGGYVPGARNKALDKLVILSSDLDRTRPVAVYCKGGYRSAIAASLLERAGFDQVINVTGGFDAWVQCQLPAVTAPTP